jgi:hypothetical protein
LPAASVIIRFLSDEFPGEFEASIIEFWTMFLPPCFKLQSNVVQNSRWIFGFTLVSDRCLIVKPNSQKSIVEVNVMI